MFWIGRRSIWGEGCFILAIHTIHNEHFLRGGLAKFGRCENLFNHPPYPIHNEHSLSSLDSISKDLAIRSILIPSHAHGHQTLEFTINGKQVCLLKRKPIDCLFNF